MDSNSDFSTQGPRGSFFQCASQSNRISVMRRSTLSGDTSRGGGALKALKTHSKPLNLTHRANSLASSTNFPSRARASKRRRRDTVSFQSQCSLCDSIFAESVCKYLLSDFGDPRKPLAAGIRRSEKRRVG